MVLLLISIVFRRTKPYLSLDTLRVTHARLQAQICSEDVGVGKRAKLANERITSTLSPFVHGWRSAPAVDMLLHFGFQKPVDGIDGGQNMLAAKGGIQQIAIAIDELVLKRLVGKQATKDKS